MRSPRKRISPAVIGCTPDSARSSVVLPRTVRADQRHDFACAHGEIHAVQHLDAAIGTAKVCNLKHAPPPLAPCLPR